MTEEEAIQKYFPEGAVNLKLKGGGNGKIQYEYEKRVMRQMLEDYSQAKDTQIKKLTDIIEAIRSQCKDGKLDENWIGWKGLDSGE